MKPRFENEMDISTYSLPLHSNISEMQLQGVTKDFALIRRKNYAEEIAGVG